MNYNDIITQVCNDKNLENIIKKKVFDRSLRNDFYQEVILKFLEYPNHQYIIDAYNGKYLNKFIVNMANYMISKTTITEDGFRIGGGSFYNEYILKSSSEDLSNHIDIESKEKDIIDQLDDKIKLERIDKVINQRRIKDLDKHYHNLIFRMYRNGMDYVDISNTLGINYHSIRHSILKTIELIKSKV